MQRIGIFGGTFDPPHVGHLIAAEMARDAYAIERMLFVPAAHSPLKASEKATPVEHRLAMTELLVAGNTNFEVSDIELKREGTSYTIDTLRALQHLNPDSALFLFIGMDNAARFQQWKDPEEVSKAAMVVALPRRGFEFNEIPDEIRYLLEVFPIPLIEVSSTEIRERVRSGKTIRYLVPPAVEQYIREKKLYLA